MKPILIFWRFQRLSVSFDTVRGSIRFRWSLKEPAHPQGWALLHRGTWYAFWSTGIRWVFQVGEKQWPMENDYECRNERVGKHRVFSIVQNETTLFSLRYRKLDQDWDLAFDLMDLEEIDFFVWITCLWNTSDRRERAVKHYAPNELAS